MAADSPGSVTVPRAVLAELADYAADDWQHHGLTDQDLRGAIKTAYERLDYTPLAAALAPDPTAANFEAAVISRLRERGSAIARWAEENRRDPGAMGPVEVATEEGVPADPEDAEAVAATADAIHAGYRDWRKSAPVEDIERVCLSPPHGEEGGR